LQTLSQLSIENKIESELDENYQDKQQTSSLSVSNNEKSSPSNITTTNNRSPADVNHLLIEQEENVDVINSTSIKQKKEQQSQGKTIPSTKIKQITNSEEQHEYYQMMSSDDESDNDVELLNTLSQLHGLIQTPQLSTEINQKKNCERKDEQQPSNFYSLTSLTSSALFNDDESHTNDIILDSDASSSLLMSRNELNTSILSSNQFINDDLQLTNRDNHNDLLQFNPTTVQNLLYRSLSSNNENEDRDKFDLTNYLHWIINHLNDDLQSSSLSNEFQQQENKKLFSLDIEITPIIENQQIEHFVDRILSQAIYEVYHEDPSLSNEDPTTNKQLLDPFDNQFHSDWISHFQSPDDPINPTNIFDQTNLFSVISNQANTIEEPVPSPLLINPFDSTITPNDSMKYSLITSVRNISTNDKSNFQDDFMLYKVIYFYKWGLRDYFCINPF
jgi:hypothetical protein